MKECSWKIFPDGEFVARKSDRPDQPFLFEREPDLNPLRLWVVDRLERRPHRWQELHDAVRSEWWLEKHVNRTVKEWNEAGMITFDLIPGKTPARSFTIASNPTLRLVTRT